MGAGLDDHQSAAVASPAGPTAIIAGPGSGKNASITARIAHLCRTGAIDASSTVALCHTTKAAGELSARLARAGVGDVTCATVHAIAWRIVRRYWTAAGHSGQPELAASTYRIVADAARSVVGKLDSGVIADIASELDWSAARLLDRGSYRAAARAAGRDVPVSVDDYLRIWEAYTDRKATLGVVDFADVIRIATDMCAQPDIGAQVRTKIVDVFVDEYQDIDPAQQQLIDVWLDGSGRICGCGDPDQSVFGFKGSEPSYLTGFADRYPGAVVHELVRNWRSSPQIVAWVNAAASVGRAPLVGMGDDGPAPTFETFGNEATEERALVTRIRDWERAGIPLAEIAVLSRFNSSSARIEAALTAASIPHHTADGTRFFDRDEIRSVLVPFGQAARRSPDSDGLSLLADAAAAVGWDRSSPPAGAGVARQRWEAITALIDLAAEHTGLSAKWLLSELQRRAVNAHDLTPGGVSVCTIHAAKGLEWDAVWVAGASEGQLPSVYATTAAELDEERHLFYVALSRARRHLVVSHAEKRHNGWSAKPSRFTELIAPAAPRPRARRNTGRNEPTTTPAAPVGRECPCGNRLIGAAARTTKRCSAACCGGEVAERHAELTAWRQHQADRLAVEPSKIVSDRGLFQLAVSGDPSTVTGMHPDAAPPPR
jgi:DNA helicase-2/ATP-dependent DNA helicase PcrA